MTVWKMDFNSIRFCITFFVGQPFLLGFFHNKLTQTPDAHKNTTNKIFAVKAIFSSVYFPLYSFLAIQIGFFRFIGNVRWNFVIVGFIFMFLFILSSSTLFCPLFNSVFQLRHTHTKNTKFPVFFIPFSSDNSLIMSSMMLSTPKVEPKFYQFFSSFQSYFKSNGRIIVRLLLLLSVTAIWSERIFPVCFLFRLAAATFFFFHSFQKLWVEFVCVLFSVFS